MTNIDCNSPDWKSRLKRTLQSGQEATLHHFSYIQDGPLCEELAFFHQMTFRFNAPAHSGTFTKKSPVG